MQNKDVLFEIGLEEVPARFLEGTIAQLKENTAFWLHNLALAYSDLHVYATPRRLAVVITALAESQPDVEEEVKGPAVKIAKNEAGEWTKAAIGFTKGQGLSVDDIYTKDIKGTEYIHVKKFIKGKTAEALLPSFKDEVILSLNFPKNMRWGSGSLRYVRPIRWIAALYGDAIIPFEINGIQSGRESFGHRFLGGAVSFTEAKDYLETLKHESVMADQKERKQAILDGLHELESKYDWSIPVDEELLEEVLYLVEYPTVFTGAYDEAYLKLPQEVLITSMKEHQRYFPVMDQSGKLLPYFVGVRNGNAEHLDIVSRGNEKVLRARLQDAQFFYEEDQKQSLDASLEKLTRMVYQVELGTIKDKTDRVTQLAGIISDKAGVKQQEKTRAVRAAEIAKFDLVTNMVDEFTELQGIMGEKYARLFGEEELVAQAIREQYLPASSHGELPESTEGIVLSIADKLDTIIGSMVIGLVPTGSQDPYGLRRQGAGILQMLAKANWSVEVETLIEAAVSLFEEKSLPNQPEDVYRKDIKQFFYQRAAQLLREQNISQDVMEAVLADQIGNYPYTVKKAALLQGLRQDEAFKSTQEALVRTLTLAQKGTDTGVNPGLFENDSEQKLFEVYQDNKTAFEAATNALDAKGAINVLSEFTDAIHKFFDNTMVMADDEKVKANRLSLLNKVAALIAAFADLTKIQWKQQV